ncbi:MAG: hypothetical protein HYS67_03255 [Deltaproteobacteria bacterium]|nr:hypothetical protein [Deltaproteobacteria bacterium]
MSASLQEKFSVLIGWEKLKRREALLISALCYSLLFSLVASPAAALLPLWADPLVVPAVIFLVLAPALFLLRPWRTGDSLRAVWLLDRTLGMEERAITAWEILGREKKGSAELLVLEEAEGRLKGVDPKAIFQRRLTWQGISAPLFFLLWLLFVFLDDGARLERSFKASQASRAAAQLREFSRELRDRAISQGLSESLEMARALERVAAERLAGEVDEKGLQENVAGLADGLRGKEEAGAGLSDLSFAMATAEGLLDLKAEMEALKTALLPDSAKGQEGPGREALERLGNLPRLKEEIGKRLPSFEKIETKDLRSLLDRLEKQVAAELDRRTLVETMEFLDHLLRGMEARENQLLTGEAGPADPGRSAQTEREKARGIFPGDQPGTKESAERSLPPFKASAGAHLKGLLGEGKGGSLSFRGEPKGGKSGVSQEEILASYRRQAEEELASERIPEALRETVKKYFLSLGMAEGKK